MFILKIISIINVLQYQPIDLGRYLFDEFNLTIEQMFSRQHFEQRYWKSSNIDSKLFNNISSKCYSIGYYFDKTHKHSSKVDRKIINTILTINSNCFYHESEVSFKII